MTFRRLALGLCLQTAASGALLLCDLDRRRAPRHAAPGVAVLQYASSQLMEEGTEGALEALRQAGFRDGEPIRIRHYNPQADMPTARHRQRDRSRGTSTW